MNPSSTKTMLGNSLDGTRNETSSTRPLLHRASGTGDPLVLLPGILSGWASWDVMIEPMARSHRVIQTQVRCVELAEASKPMPASYGIPAERDALLATVDALDLERFDLVGWSLGAAVSLAFTLQFPERVRSLTLIEPPAFWIVRETGHAQAELKAFVAEAEATANTQITVDDLKAFLVQAGLGAPGDDFSAHPRWSLMVRNRQCLAANAAIMSHQDSVDRLRALPVPILAVKGLATSPVLAAVVDDLAAIAPNATMLELPGGHACHLENQEAFLTAVEAFIARHAG